MRARFFPSSAPACLKVSAVVVTLAAVIAFTSSSPGTARLQAQSSSPGLIQASDLVYQGAFRLPAGASDQTTFAYGGTALAFDPARNSIWAVGHDWYQSIAEFSVPAAVNSTNVGSLPRATLLSGWIDTGWRANVVGGNVKIGGILPLANGDKIVTAFGYYDTVGTSVSHFRLAANGGVTGPVQMGTVSQQAGFYAGWIVPVPPAWQAQLGGTAMTGQCCLSIITRTSFGPALAVFDPLQIGNLNPVPITDVLKYPSTHPTIGDCGTQGALFNCTANMAGAVFVPGTRSVLFFQKIGTGPVTYNAGFSAPPYKTQVLAYDVNDLVLVRQGAKQPWDVVPYATWDLPWTVRILGVTLDPATNRIFLSLEYQDGQQPLIHVYSVAGATGSAPAPPPSDTTAPVVAVAAPTSGATVSGIVTVSANATDNVAVAGVQFTLDGSNLGLEDTTAPYQVSWSTTSTGNGSHTLRAIARDAAGNPATSSAVTVTVSNGVADVTPPTVALTSPAAGTVASGTITLTATAADNVGIAGVRFTVDGVAYGSEDTSAPYAATWSTTATPNGPHTLRAIARDAAGNASTSPAVTLTVDNGASAPPVPSTVIPVAPPLPSPTGNVINVSTVGELQAALSALTSNTTILLAPGTYALTSTLFVNGAFANVTIRGASNNRNDVVLVGRGMGVANSAVPHGIWAGGNVTGLTIANLTIRDVYQHAIMFNAGTESPRLYNVHLADAGQQLLKASPDGVGGGVDNGVVEYSVFEYTTTAVDDYTNGIDVHTGRDWRIRHNLFRRIRAPEGKLAGPAILFWNGSSGTTVDGNAFVDCQREISLGLIDRASSDHTGGVVRNNFIVRNAGMGGDVAIAVFDSPQTNVLHNTILLNGQYPNAIEYRFAGTGVAIVNNLSDGRAQARDGATAALLGNVWTAAPGWFVDPVRGDLHLTSLATAAIDGGVVTDAAESDWDNEARPQGHAPDIGADEHVTSGPSTEADSTPPSVQIVAPAAGSTVSGPVTVSASATDNVAVAGVQFLLDGAALGSEDLSAPYSVSWSSASTSNGSHSLRAVARDAAGHTTTSAAITVTVNNVLADTTAPTVAVTAPAVNATVSGTVTVAASASDNVGVAGVLFTVDGTPIGAEDTSLPYQITWTTTAVGNGSHTLQAIARDGAGNTRTSPAVTVTVNNPVLDTTAPNVSISSPLGGTTVSGTVAITAAATDNVGVIGVRFMVDGVNYGTEDPGAPYAVSWSTVGLSNGAHELRAVARDAAGHSSTSPAVTVMVNNGSTEPEPEPEPVPAPGPAPTPSPTPATVVPIAPPLPTPSGDVLHVSSVMELHAAIAAMRSNLTILIAPGVYPLASTLWINGSFSNVTIRGASNSRDDVILMGRGMTSDDTHVPHGIWAGGAVTGLTIANLTIRDVPQHGILFNAGTESPRVYNVRIVDAGQQLLKASPDGFGGGVDQGVVEYSIFEYTGTAASALTNGVEVQTGRNWLIRHNLFRRIRSPQKQLAGPAVLVWNGSIDTIVHGNVFIDCERDISLGLIDRAGFDHAGGIIRNNVIVRNVGMGGDVAIGVFDSPNTKVIHNTVLLNKQYPHAIEYRFAGSTGVTILNNLSDGRILSRNGATGTVLGNVLSAVLAWFVDPASGDVHLNSTATGAIDRGVPTADAPLDWDNQQRPVGAGPDVGADETAGPSF